MTLTALSAVTVIELGARIGAGVCGSLLAQLGAEVIVIEPAETGRRHKWRNRAAVVAGKLSIIDDFAADESVCGRLLTAADVVLISSDIAPAPGWKRGAHQLVCDITAFGGARPLFPTPFDDALIQAVAGLVDTTGDPAGPPSVIGFPILEHSAGIYAASAVIAALRVRNQRAVSQDLEVALFDCAVSALPAFLPFPMTGKSVTRSGNGHPLAAPWNAYRANDGWILLCTATDEQWGRLCATMDQPQLAREPAFATNPARVKHALKVDAIVQSWISPLTMDECVKRLGRISIPCGPIVTIDALFAHENLVHRDMAHRSFDPVSAQDVVLPGSPFKASRTPGVALLRIPRPGEDRLSLMSRALPARGRGRQPTMVSDVDAARPLAGLRVLEIGQYTTAPLAARQLGALGAEIIKIEPPGGDGCRYWPPQQGNQGYFFALNNSGKRSVLLDLKDDSAQDRFRSLLESADVLVENLKPGALARLGMSAEALAKINPRLVCCSISGFGIHSMYPGRPAFDTVIQAMCGFMDLTRAGGMPAKTGISSADILGGQFALAAILAALDYRERSGLGQFIDISMQDVGAWVAHQELGCDSAHSQGSILKCADGYVLVNGIPAQVQHWLKDADMDITPGAPGASSLSRSELAASATAAGLAAAPVNSIREVVHHAHTAARQLITYCKDSQGLTWPLLTSPLRFSKTPLLTGRPIGPLGEANLHFFRAASTPDVLLNTADPD